jgi:hypothetical protein
MTYRTCGLAPVCLVAFALGCSSHSNHASSSDGGKVSEAGALDRGSALDGAHAHDSGGLDLSTSEAGAARDARDAGNDGQARDAKDASIEASALDASNRDGNLDGKRDVVPDVYQPPDVPVDTAPLLGTCSAPIELPYYLSHADITINTANAEHFLDFPCASNGGDVVLKLQSNQTELAYADTFGSTWNTALFFSETCDSASPPVGDGMAVCNDDACGTSQSQAFAKLAYGYHYLIVSGVNGESGPVTVHFQHAPIGNGPLVTLPQGAGTAVGTTSGIDTTRTCDTSGPKNSYWWTTCPGAGAGNLHASTCGGATWDTSLILQIPRLDVLSCSDDDPACGMQSTVDTSIAAGAGMFVLTVTGTLLDSHGDYALTYIRP